MRSERSERKKNHEASEEEQNEDSDSKKDSANEETETNDSTNAEDLGLEIDTSKLDPTDPSNSPANLALLKRHNFDISRYEGKSFKPQTMSMVLPCAGEADYALKTVKAVYDSTPPSLLKVLNPSFVFKKVY